MRLNKNKNATLIAAVIGAAITIGTQSAAAQNMRMDDHLRLGSDLHIAVDLLKSDMFDALIDAKIAMPAEPSSIVSIDPVTTAALPFARIRHDFVPLPEKYYRTHAEIGPARSIDESDLKVRVVYANPIALEDTIDFTRP